MDEQFFIRDSKKVVSSQEASVLYGITNDYVARLCRQGKLVGRLEGRMWFVERSSLEAFFGTVAAPLVPAALAAKFLSSREAAKAYRVSHDYIARLCREGKVAGQLRDRVWYADTASLEKFFGAAPANKESAPSAQPVLAIPVPSSIRSSTPVSAAAHRPLLAALALSLMLGAAVMASSAVSGRQAPELAAALARVESPFFAPTFYSFTQTLEKISRAFAPAPIATNTPAPTQNTPAATVSHSTTTQTLVTNTYPVVERTLERVVEGSTADLSNFITYDFFNSQIERLQDAIADKSSGTGGGGITDFSSLTAGDIPDLSATYLKLTGGTLSGALALPSVSASATSSFAGVTLNMDCTGFGSGGVLTTDPSGNIICANDDTVGSTFAYPFPSNATTTQIAFNGGLTAVGATTTALAVTGSSTVSSVLNVGGVLNANGGVVGNLTGNASTATALQTGRTINGILFDGTANITINAASSTLLANDNTWSGTNTFSNPIIASITGNAATVTNGVYTTTFNSLFDARFITQLAATTSIASITTLPNLSLPYSQLTGTPSIAAYPFPSNATTTLIAFNGGLSSASTTLTGPFIFANATGTNATTTAFATANLVVSGNTTAASTTLTGNTLLTSATSTNFFATSLRSTGATTTALAVTGITSSLLKTNSNGSVVAAILGTDYQNFAYPFAGPNNSTSTLTQFNGGLTAFASSTIGAGGATTGLTIDGGATTTGNLFVSGIAGIGTQPTVGLALKIAGNFQTSGNVQAAAGTVANPGFFFHTSGSNPGLFSPGSNLIAVSTAGVERARFDAAGNLGLGTTTPFAKLSISANLADTNPVLFAIASTTGGTATSTLFSVSNTGSTTLFQLSSALLKTNSSGTIVAAVPGTDYLTTATTFAYPFPSNATTTQIAFNGGLTAVGATTTALAVTGSSTVSSILNVGGAIAANGTLTVLGNTTLAGATSTSFAISGISSGNILKTTTGGAVIAAVAGTDFTTPSGVAASIAAAYPFQGANNSTSTLTQFNAGLSAYASSTIGAGGQITGLTVSGGATTTGNAYIGGALGVGTPTPGVVNGFNFSSNVGLDMSGSGTKFLLVNQGGTGGILLNDSSQSVNNRLWGLDFFQGSGKLSFNAYTDSGSARTRMLIDRSGVVGIGTTSPFAGLSIQSWVNNNLGTTLFAVASSSETATTTLFSISNTGTIKTAITSCAEALETDSNGNIVCGTDATGGGGSYPFAGTGNSTSTLTQFNAGLTAYASSTIGNGTAGLTISGNGTTTGNAYFGGRIGIGVVAPATALDVSGNIQVDAGLSVTGGNLANTGTGSLLIGASGSRFIVTSTTGLTGVASTSPWARLSVDTTSLGAGIPSFVVGSSTRTDFVVTQAGNVGIGSTTPWAKLSIDPTSTNIFTPSFAIGSSSGTAFVVTQEGFVGIGTTTPWSNSSGASALLDLTANGSVRLMLHNTATGQEGRININSGFLFTASGASTASTNAFIFQTANTNSSYSATERMRITSAGDVGIGTTSPWARMSVDTSSLAAGVPSFVVSSSTRTDLIVTQAGNVGVGTTSPRTALHVVQGASGALPWVLNASETTVGTFEGAGNSYISILTPNANQSGILFGNPSSSLAGAIVYNNTATANGLQFRTNGNNTRAVIDASGNVGIGTTSPGSLLSVGDTNGINFSTATSTFSSTGGVNLTSGCFAIRGACIGYTVKLVAIYATSTPGVNASVVFTGATASAPSFSAGTVTLPRNTSYITAEVWGGGGGGSGAGTGSLGNGGLGTTTCFGTSNAASDCSQTVLMKASGGGGGLGGSINGGFGGSTVSGDFTMVGSPGISGVAASAGFSAGNTGGNGGNAPRGGAGGLGRWGSAGTVGNAPGGGGAAGGCGATASCNGGSGGGSGAYATSLITSPSGTYYYTVGPGGTAGAAGTSGTAGGAGGAGGIVISVYATSSANSAGNDYAEMFPVSNPNINAGDIVAVDRSTPVSMKLAQAGDASLAGIISTAPGQTLGDINAPGMRPVALSGRVPAKVNLEGGFIRAGDRIAPSSVPGIGKKAGPTDASVGIALEDFSGAINGAGSLDGSGNVLVFVTIQQGSSVDDIGRALLGAASGVASSTATPASPFDFVGGVMAAFASRINTFMLGITSAPATSTAADAVLPEQSFLGSVTPAVFSKLDSWLAVTPLAKLSIVAGRTATKTHLFDIASLTEQGTTTSFSIDTAGNALIGADVTSSITVNAGTFAFANSATTTIAAGDNAWAIATSVGAVPIFSISAPTSSVAGISVNGAFYLNGADVGSVLASSSATATPEALVQSPFAAATDALKSAVSSALASIQSIAHSGVRTLGAAVYAGIGVFDEVFTQTLTATTVNVDTVNAKEVCLDGLCINKEQLQQLLNDSGSSGGSGGKGGESAPEEPPVDDPPADTPAEEPGAPETPEVPETPEAPESPQTPDAPAGENAPVTP